MSFPADQLDPVVELYVGNTWTDVTPHVYLREDVHITRGSSSEDGQPPPSKCTLQLNNRSGRYSPRNPMGPFYGALGRNSPIRLGIRQSRDTFGRTVASSWGYTDTAQFWDVFGTGGTVANANWNVGGGVATHSIPATTAYRASYLPYVSYRDVDVAASFLLPFADTLSGDVEPGNLMLRGVSTTNYYMARVVVTSADAVTVKFMHANGTTYGTTATVTGLTHTGQWLRVRVQAEGQTFRAKVWAAAGAEPFGWNLAVRIPDAPRSGWVGIRNGIGAGNTNPLPMVISVDDWEVKRPRFAGEVAEWPPRWDLAEVDAYVPIEAAGIKRRLGQGAAVLQSALRRSIPVAPSLVAYWSLEDGEDATVFGSALGGSPMEPTGPVEFSTFDGFAASEPLPEPSGGSIIGRVPAHTATGVIQARWLQAVPSGGATNGTTLVRIYTSGTALYWDVVYLSGGALEIRAFTGGAVQIFSQNGAFGVDGKLLRLSVELVQDGADVDWQLSILEVGSNTVGLISNTIAGYTIGMARDVRIAPNADIDDVAFGHVSVQTVQTSLFDLSAELRAFDGERAGDRIVRLCRELDVPVAVYGDPANTTPMGPQGIATLLELLEESAEADQGTLSESRGELGFAYRTRVSKYNQPNTVVIDHDAGQLGEPFEPVDDDRSVANDVTVKRPNGSQARAQRESGPMSVLDAADGGIGRYDVSVTLNVQSDLQLPDLAGWLMHLGTVNEPRYPVLSVNLANASVAADVLATDILDLDVDDRLSLINARGLNLYDDVAQLARGYTEVINAFDHRIAVNCTPASPYEVLTLDALGSKLDSSSSTLDAAVTDVATTLLVKSTAERWTTDGGQMPIPITIGGETMTATAVGAATPTFVAAGAAAHANNASPGAVALPAGLQAGDLLLVLAAVRSTSMAAFVPAGYTLLADATNVRLFGKIATGAEAAPVVTFAGSVANATCSAQCAAFRGVSLSITGAAVVSINSSAQNIAYPLRTLPRGAGALVLHLGWKSDDWTSVATLTGATEIGEPSSTLGDDQGFVWDYRVVDGSAAAVEAGSFTVTGGASATSRGLALALYATQAFTVNRSNNGVVKPHAAGAEVHVSTPATLAL